GGRESPRARSRAPRPRARRRAACARDVWRTRGSCGAGNVLDLKVRHGMPFACSKHDSYTCRSRDVALPPSVLAGLSRRAGRRPRASRSPSGRRTSRQNMSATGIVACAPAATARSNTTSTFGTEVDARGRDRLLDRFAEHDDGITDGTATHTAWRPLLRGESTLDTNGSGKTRPTEFRTPNSRR